MVQWLRLCVPKAGGPGLIPGQGTRYRMHKRRKEGRKGGREGGREEGRKEGRADKRMN